MRATNGDFGIELHEDAIHVSGSGANAVHDGDDSGAYYSASTSATASATALMTASAAGRQGARGSWSRGWIWNGSRWDWPRVREVARVTLSKRYHAGACLLYTSDAADES